MGDFSKVIHPYLLKLSLCGTKNFLHWFNGLAKLSFNEV